MIKAHPHQQQPPNVMSCQLCGAQFNNQRRLNRHFADVRHCPHDGQKCRHECKGDECWRELDGS